MASVPARQSVVVDTPFDHMHGEGQVCPYCEQPIPNSKLEEIRERMEAKDRERTTEITSQVQARYSRAQAEVEAKAKADVEQAQQEAAAALDEERKSIEARLAAAREEAAREAGAEAKSQLAEMEKANRELSAGLEEERTSVEARLAAARAEATREAEAQAQTRATEMEKANLELSASLERAAADKTELETTRNDLQRQIAEAREQSAAAIAKVEKAAKDNEIIIREDARNAAGAEYREQLAALQRTHTDAEAGFRDQVQAAEAAKSAAEEQVRTITDTFDAKLGERVQEVRKALEDDRDKAILEEKSKAFQEKQKLLDEFEQMKRSLEKKTAEDLGEGAEVRLEEVLRAEFPDDKIEPVAKGVAGADIIHTVMHNGKACGIIVYDSKNRNQWRTEFVTKLATDQLAAKAEHAILSSHKFPAGARQLHLQDGVIVANPARIAAIVHVLRRHIVQNFALRLSTQERAKKTAALYSFITSERCTEMFGRIESNIDSLLQLQVDEKKAHEKMWAKQGKLLAATQKVRADIGLEIDTIIGIADTSGTEDE